MLDRFSLAGRRALITGSTQGIGNALARGLAEAGAKVVLNGRDEPKLKAAVAAFVKLGFTADGAAFDVTDPQSVLAAVGRLEKAGGPIDILVNNTGIHRRAPLAEMSVEDWRKVIETDLSSAFYVARAVAPGMIARKAGKIVNVCSVMSELARPTTGNYAAAKGGLKMLTRAMCAEWARENLQINGLAPGYIKTELTKPLVEDPKFDAWIRSRTPAARWGEVEDLVGACIYLCSPASAFVNGHILFIDGGMSAVV